jgi:hypothetical protein
MEGCTSDWDKLAFHISFPISLNPLALMIISYTYELYIEGIWAEGAKKNI